VAVIAAVAVILVEVVISPRRLVGPEWAASAGVAAIGAVATGVAAIGAVATGMAAIGAVATGVAAIGKTGTTIGVTITTTMMSSLSVASAFHRGGVGDGDTHMDITATGILMAMGTRTAMATGAMATGAMATAGMDTVTTVTVMVMDTAVAGTALPLGREWLNYSADSPAPAIIADQSMVSWGLRLGGQFELTSRTAVTQADRVPSGDDAFSEP
jgi:hypothetical protein